MNDAMRIGSAERDRAADELGEHYAMARLDESEYAERLDAAWSARTQADLDGLFFDLPPLSPASPGAHQRDLGRRRERRDDRRPERWGWRGGVPLVPVLTVLGVLFVITHIPFFLIIGLVAGAFWFHRSRSRSRDRGSGSRRWG